jgi:hypothetical protein
MKEKIYFYFGYPYTLQKRQDQKGQLMFFPQQLPPPEMDRQPQKNSPRPRRRPVAVSYQPPSHC